MYKLCTIYIILIVLLVQDAMKLLIKWLLCFLCVNFLLKRVHEVVLDAFHAKAIWANWALVSTKATNPFQSWHQKLQNANFFLKLENFKVVIRIKENGAITFLLLLLSKVFSTKKSYWTVCILDSVYYLASATSNIPSSTSIQRSKLAQILDQHTF